MLPTSLNQVRNLLSSGTPFVAIKKLDRLKAGECMPLCAMMACQRDAKRGELVLHILNDRDSRLKSLAFWNLSRDGTHDEPMYTIFFPPGGSSEMLMGFCSCCLRAIPVFFVSTEVEGKIVKKLMTVGSIKGDSSPSFEPITRCLPGCATPNTFCDKSCASKFFSSESRFRGRHPGTCSMAEDLRSLAGLGSDYLSVKMRKDGTIESRLTTPLSKEYRGPLTKKEVINEYQQFITDYKDREDPRYIQVVEARLASMQASDATYSARPPPRLFNLICFECNKKPASGHKLMKCGSCMVAVYCNEECQRRHWGRHKKICKSIAQKSL